MEYGPVQTGEVLPAAPGERVSETNFERAIENRPEVGSTQAEAAQIAMPMLPTPVITQDDAATGIVTDDAQLVASDDDLIEKEWVEKAKKILGETKDDPYRREREVSKLQIEYIRKRYGRVIGDSGE